MAGRYGMTILGVFLCGAVAASSIAAESSPFRFRGVGKNYAFIESTRPSQKLVLSSASVLVKDQETGELLVQKQTETVLPIASITKLMTAMVVLDAGLDLQAVITIESVDMDTLKHSHSHLPVGTRLTRKDALMLALMSSENRAARALGRTYPGGMSKVVGAMNAKARALGLTETRFEDPAGLSSGNVSSARDLALMADAAYRYQLVRAFTTREEATLHSGRRVLGFCNSNRLIRNHRWQIGLSKTGYIDESGHCLVMQAQLANRPLLIVLLDAQGKQARFSDANRIRQWIEGPVPARQNRRG